MTPMVTNLFGYNISNGSVSESIQKAWPMIQDKSKSNYLACANPHSLVKATSDPLFSNALKTADILLPDGSGILLAAKCLNLPMTEKIAGSDFFRECNKKADAAGSVNYFFLGSSDKVLHRITEKLEREFKQICVCGTYSPPFKMNFDESDNQKMITAVNKAKPDILWVGMTAPKQEKWIYENKDRLNVPFIAAIGAVFDFYAGNKMRSSPFWIDLGLEWLPRFIKEPKRLWERNLKSTPVFLWWILRQAVTRKMV
jgi:N-acetylglucosaminyldiphosphoundecaprenol N-acetyl-beta-D-mannosaminyltransferase